MNLQPKIPKIQDNSTEEVANLMRALKTLYQVILIKHLPCMSQKIFVSVNPSDIRPTSKNISTSTVIDVDLTKDDMGEIEPTITKAVDFFIDQIKTLTSNDSSNMIKMSISMIEPMQSVKDTYVVKNRRVFILTVVYCTECDQLQRVTNLIEERIVEIGL